MNEVFQHTETKHMVDDLQTSPTTEQLRMTVADVENFFAEVLFEMLESQIEKETGIMNPPPGFAFINRNKKTA